MTEPIRWCQLGQVPTASFHALFEFLAVLDNARFDHLTQQVVSFTVRSPTPAKTEIPSTLGDVVDQFHDQYRLAYTGTAEQSDLTTLGVRLNKSMTLIP